MMVKIDTREKFHVITIHEDYLAANMTEQMDKVVLTLLDDNVKNVILNMKDIKKVDSAAAGHLVKQHDTFAVNEVAELHLFQAVGIGGQHARRGRLFARLRIAQPGQ